MEESYGDEVSPYGVRILRTDIEDDQGLPLRVLTPEGIQAEEGIPVSMPFDLLFGHLPVDFRKRLYNALWDRGLIEPKDFLKPDSGGLYKAAILSLIRVDFADLVRLAQETLTDA